jgi:glycosyltransferase involved in cell wall biosynthesis
VLQLRGSDFKNWINNRAYFLTRWYAKRILKSTQGMIVLGNKLRYLFEEYYSKERIFVVPNGANFKVENKKRVTTETINLLYLANLQSSKGIEDVIEAVVVLKNKYKQNFIFTVVGAWRKEETREKCLALVEQNNIPVQFHPPQIKEAKFKLLSEADIFIFTPREPEGHPWVIVEAMAFGLPIISTDQGAITESVHDNVNGFIVEPKCPEQIAEKLNLLIANIELRKKMGEESRRIYEQDFTETKMVERFTAVFNSILNDN